MVDIYVGPEWQNFRVHKKLLCARVPYFKDLVEDKGYIGYAPFPDQDPEAFDALLGWVYTGELRASSSTKAHALAVELGIRELEKVSKTLDKQVEEHEDDLAERACTEAFAG
jgi:BTB/POZ domain